MNRKTRAALLRDLDAFGQPPLSEAEMIPDGVRVHERHDGAWARRCIRPRPSRTISLYRLNHLIPRR
jgi:hypothetical protein